MLQLITDDQVAEEERYLSEVAGLRPATGAGGAGGVAGGATANIAASAATAESSTAGSCDGAKGTKLMLTLPSTPQDATACLSRQESMCRRAPGVPPEPPQMLGIMLKNGFCCSLVLRYVLRRVEAADEPRVEQMLKILMGLGAPILCAHEDFVGGLVTTLIAEPRRRLTARVARAVVREFLVPLAARLPYAHTQLLRLLTSQWRTLSALSAVGVTKADGGESTADSTLGGSLPQDSASDAPLPSESDGDGQHSEAFAERALTLLQYAVREARSKGAVGEQGAAASAAMQPNAIERAYAKLDKLVPAGILLTK